MCDIAFSAPVVHVIILVHFTQMVEAKYFEMHFVTIFGIVRIGTVSFPCLPPHPIPMYRILIISLYIEEIHDNKLKLLMRHAYGLYKVG